MNYKLLGFKIILQYAVLALLALLIPALLSYNWIEDISLITRMMMFFSLYGVLFIVWYISTFIYAGVSDLLEYVGKRHHEEEKWL